MPNTPQALDELLTRMGFPVGSRPDPSRFGYALQSTPYGQQVPEWALFEPLRQRGWLLHFDAEGSFMLPGEHSKLMQALLTVARVTPLPAVHDGWLERRGWAFAIQDEARSQAVWDRSCLEYPSDWVQLGAVIAVVDAYLPTQSVISLLTDDQSAVVAVLPDPVFRRLQDEAWLVPAEEAEWRLEPELMLFESAAELVRTIEVEPLPSERVWGWAESG